MTVIALILILMHFNHVLSTTYPYEWKLRDTYYYNDIAMKMKLLIIWGNCTSFFYRLSDNTIKIPKDVGSIYISSFPSNESLFLWWKSIPKPIQHRVDPYICDMAYRKRLAIFNNTKCQLPTYMNPSAPRCQTKYLEWICNQSKLDIYNTKPNYFIIPESNHNIIYNIPPQPWLLTTKQTFVSMCGQILLSCGVIHTNTNCRSIAYQTQAKSFQKYCPLSLLSSHKTSSIYQPINKKNITISKCHSKAPFDQMIYYYDKVFVIAQVDDTYIYHIHLEILPRIVYHLDFLLKNPDIQILYGCDIKGNHKATAKGLRQGLKALKPMLSYIGISISRLIIHKHIYANEIYLPMEGACQDPVYNTWHILHMRNLFLNKLNLFSYQTSSIIQKSASIISMKYKNKTKPIMLLLRRSSSSIHTRNGFDLVRQWNDNFTYQLLDQLQLQFPSYHVQLFNDRNYTLMECFQCQIEIFSKVNVLIGYLHIIVCYK